MQDFQLRFVFVENFGGNQNEHKLKNTSNQLFRPNEAGFDYLFSKQLKLQASESGFITPAALKKMVSVRVLAKPLKMMHHQSFASPHPRYFSIVWLKSLTPHLGR